MWSCRARATGRLFHQLHGNTVGNITQKYLELNLVLYQMNGGNIKLPFSFGGAQQIQGSCTLFWRGPQPRVAVKSQGVILATPAQGCFKGGKITKVTSELLWQTAGSLLWSNTARMRCWVAIKGCQGPEEPGCVSYWRQEAVTALQKVKHVMIKVFSFQMFSSVSRAVRYYNFQKAPKFRKV